jgi:hypothetical protein
VIRSPRGSAETEIRRVLGLSLEILKKLQRRRPRRSSPELKGKQNRRVWSQREMLPKEEPASSIKP